MKNIFKSSFLIKIIFAFSGSILGFLYYFYIGCAGSCPISSNPYFSSLYGLVLGYFLAETIFGGKNETKRKNETNN